MEKPVWEGEAIEEDNANQLTFNVESVLTLGAICTQLGFTVGIQKWIFWYIEDNGERFPDSNTAGTNQDEEWALGTKEVIAWKYLRNVSGGLYGSALFFWAMNVAWGGTGNMIHTMYFLDLQVMKLAPLVTFIFLYEVERMYISTDAHWVEQATDSDGDSNTRNQNFLFDPAKADDNETYYNDPTWWYRKWGILLSLCFNFWVYFATSKA